MDFSLNNVLFITSSICQRNGGPSWVVVNLAKQFTLSGYSVYISSFGNSYSDLPELELLKNELSLVGVNLDIYFSKYLNSYGFYNLFKIFKIIRNIKVSDRIILNYVYSVPVLLFTLLSKRDSEVYLMPHGSLGRNEFRKLKSLKYLFLLILRFFGFHRRFHFVFASNLERKNFLLKNSVNSSVIGFGVDSSPQLFKYKHPGNRLLFLGRIDKVKNLESLLCAMKIMVLDGCEIFLEIAGDGNASEILELKRLVTEFALNNYVEFTGWRTATEKEESMKRSNALVLPSHSENFGVVVLEAAAKGIPSIISPNVGIAEKVLLAEAGVVALSTRPADIAKAISALFSELDKYSSNAYFFSKKNSWDSIALEWDSLFKN